MIQIKPEIYYGKILKENLTSHLVGQKILILISKTVWDNSYLYSELNELIGNYDLKIYTNIRPNAPISDLDKIVKENNRNPPTTILAIGGGSVIDAAKVLSIAFEGIKIKDLFYKKVPLPTNSIHLVAIPTTAGTGAELSFGAIIFDDEKLIKDGIRGNILQPKIVLIDAELYKTAPKKLISEVGFDCLTHAIETYISKKSNGMTEYQSIAAIKTVLTFLPNAVDGELDALKQMAIASSMMGINLAFSTTCLPHRLQYIIGPLTNTSHAQGLIALYKGWIPLLEENKVKSGLKNLEYDLGGIDLIQKITDLKDTLNLNYNLKTLGLNSNQIEEIANKTGGALDYDPIFENKNTLIKLLEKSL